jgi:hypothetical protein
MHEDAMKLLYGSTLALAALLTQLPACEQPKAGCTAGVGAFAAKYEFKPGSKVGTGTCDTLKGEILGLAKYNPSTKEEETIQDLTRATLAIRTSKLGGLAVECASVADAGAGDAGAGDAGAGAIGCVEDKNQKLESIGDFVSTTPDDKDVCSVPTLSAAEQDLPAFQTPTMMYPAAHIKYEWSKVRLYVTAAYPGTQMVGDLTYTEDGCSASYSVIGLWPAVSCAGDDGQGNPIADATLCDPVADPTAGRPTGSGINPDLKARLKCDPDTLLCALMSAPDALK